MSETETPLCQELHASSLDSNDIRAWRSLAYRLERGLTLLGHSTLSQEAVRDEALEEAARVCENFPTLVVPFLRGEIAKHIRALKREPNAAAESYEAVHPKALDEPAPAAPDVVSSKELISLAEEVDLTLAGHPAYKLTISSRRVHILAKEVLRLNGRANATPPWKTMGASDD